MGLANGADRAVELPSRQPNTTLRAIPIVSSLPKRAHARYIS